MTTTHTHPLLAPRAIPEGYCYYVYTAADMDEIMAAIWVPAEDKGAAARAIKLACGRGLHKDSIRDAIRRLGGAAAAPATLPTKKAAPRRKPTHGAWCRRCHGPSADGSGLCHEC